MNWKQFPHRSGFAQGQHGLERKPTLMEMIFVRKNVPIKVDEKGHFFREDKKKKEKIMFYFAIWKTLLSKGHWKWNVFVRSENRSWSLLLLSDLRKSHQPPSHTLENVKNNFFMQKKKKFLLDPEIDGKLFVIPLWPPSYWANPNLWSPASWAVGWYQPPWRRKQFHQPRV